MEEEDGADEGISVSTTTRTVRTPVSFRKNGSQTCSALLLKEARKAPSTSSVSAAVKRLELPENCETANETNWLKSGAQSSNKARCKEAEPVAMLYEEAKNDKRWSTFMFLSVDCSFRPSHWRSKNFSSSKSLSRV
jgi:hypothetical protein